MKSYFTHPLASMKVERLENPGKCPTWLIHILGRLSKNIKVIPIVEEKEEGNATGYVYPH